MPVPERYKLKDHFDDLDYMVLSGVNKNRTYREIGVTIFRSLGSVQMRITWLAEQGYIKKVARKRKGVSLTEKGKETLQNAGIKLE
jgi:hypothetical protein